MPSARRRTTAYSIVLLLSLGQIVLAMLLPRDGCHWTLGIYATTGAAVLGTVLSAPYVMRRGFARENRGPAAMGFALLALTSWLVGWFVAFANQNCGA